MVTFITEMVNMNNSEFIKIANELALFNIYNLFKNDICDTSILSSDECLYYGWHYMHIKKDYELGKNYYLMGVKHKHPAAIV